MHAAEYPEGTGLFPPPTGETRKAGGEENESLEAMLSRSISATRPLKGQDCELWRRLAEIVGNDGSYFGELVRDSTIFS